MAKNKQIELPPITLLANGATEEIREANLDAVMPSPGYPDTCFLLVEAITKRADIILLDYTRDQVAVQFQIDGVWHTLPPRDRASGDYMLASLKKLADLNYLERRARQEGEFGAQYRMKTHRIGLTSQGVRTGERVAIRIDYKRKPLEKLDDIGIRPKLQEKFRESLHQQHGMVLMSCLPGDGKSTLWRCSVNASDRFMRDFYSLEDQAAPEPEIINVEQVFYDRRQNETPGDKLPKLLLRQPDVLCFPDFVDGETMTTASELVTENQKLVIGFTPSRSAIEALLRILLLKPDVPAFAESLTCVLHQRLIRRLCENCKQPYQPTPALLQKLGLSQGRVSMLYDEWRPPPPEEQVDAKGNPIEIPICPKCNGVGYRGRTAFFELLMINDEIRRLLVERPSLEALTQAAHQAGHIGLKDEGIVLVAKGETSVAELQRVLKR